MNITDIKACAVFPERDAERVAKIVDCPKKSCLAPRGKPCRRKGQPLDWPHGLRLQEAVTLIVARHLTKGRRK